MNMAESWDDLDLAMNGDDEDFAVEPDAIQGDEQANRTLGRLARVRRHRAQDRDIYEAQLAQLNDWHHRRTEIHDNAEGWYLRQLQGYHRAVLEIDPRRKSIDLPNGVLRSIAGQPKWEFGPEFLPWAHGNRQDLIRVKYEPDKTVAKKALDIDDGKVIDPATGEVVPGVTVTPPERSFTVDTEPNR